MEFEWDEEKRQSLIAERDVDFRKAALILEGPIVTDPDTRHDYGGKEAEMARENIRRASLEELRRMYDAGHLHDDKDAPEGPPPGEELPDDFWDNAKVVFPKEPRSVHLKLDPDVFDYFKSLGKGHITKMQEVLRAYANAHRR